ncbi:unnamed protein product [Sphagnum jensenii]|uniref:4-coumarate--CoA ligase n=1 Tax=Sphagnum jensenii TaxID=128206 RepID=A0ABP0WPW8_9BRYO
MDWRSGYGTDGIYRNLRTQLSMPKEAELDLVTFLFSGKAGDPQLANTAALVDAETGEQLTFGELGVTVRSIAAGLAELGVRQGSTVMILLGNSIFFPVIFMAITSIGAVVTTVNPLNTRYEIAKQMRDSRTRFLITIPQLVSKVEGLESLLGLILLENPSSSSVAAAAAATAEEYKNNKLSFTPFSKLLATNPDKAPRVRIRQTDTAALLYSSGTTGASKGVVITHKSFIAAQIIAADGINEFRDLPPHEVVLGLVPFFHVFGLALMGCADLRAGATVVVMSKFGIVEMLETIQKYRVTSLPVVPPIVLALCRPGVMDAYDVSSVSNIACGAAPLSKELTERCAAKFPNATINQGYGLTESTSMGTSTIPVSKDRKRDLKSSYGSAGWLVNMLEAMVVDVETGRFLPPNCTGELWIRGPSLMQEYLNNAEATAATLDKQGWLHTGDLVYIDSDGCLFVVDRIKELIKYKGFQVAPAELEAILTSHPSIFDAAVVPLPDEEAGQVPIAYIVCNPERLVTEKQVLDFVAEQVAPYKKLRRVTFLEAIPRSSSGKILRRELTQKPISKL